jgi:hypothetical protein
MSSSTDSADEIPPPPQKNMSPPNKRLKIRAHLYCTVYAIRNRSCVNAAGTCSRATIECSAFSCQAGRVFIVV